MIRRFTYSLVLLSVLAISLRAEDATRLLRFPDIHEDSIVFVHGGDLWRVATGGGTAVRLTAHPGLEVFPKFSPDGQQIAFTGQYDGDEQVYAISAVGGAPVQLTYYPAVGPLPDRWGFDNQVYGWSVNGKDVLFRSARQAWGLTDTRLYTVALDGGLPEPLPMRVSGAGDFSPDGKKVVFSPLIRDFRTWKRYEGGWAQDLFVIDLVSNEVKQITDNPRSDRDPMWIGNRIYFSSDRTGTLNLFYYDLKTEKTKQVTESTQYDVRWPSKGDKHIVYELGGELHILNTDSGKSRRVEIYVPSDGLASRPHRVAVGDQVSDFGLSPKSKRAVLTARGDIFTIPIKKGPVRNLTRSSSAHDKAAEWSPDGSQIVFISDRDGEEELYLIDQKGGDAEQLTRGGTAMRYRPSWSPNGDHIAFSDKDGKVYVIDVESKEVNEIADDQHGQIGDYAWSPHSGYLAFSMTDDNFFSSIHIYDLEDRSLHRVTNSQFIEFEPVWDPNGKYLYFFADREFAPQIGSMEWNYVQNRSTGVFAISLQKDGKHPYPPESDEVKVDEDEDDEDEDDEDEDDEDEDDEDEDDEDEDDEDEDDEDEDDEDEDDEEGDDEEGDDGKTKEVIKIDFDRIGDRVCRVPISADNYRGLEAIEGHLIYVRSGPFVYGRESGVSTDLMKFSHKDREAKVWVKDAGGYTLSRDGKHALVRTDGKLKLHPVSKGDAETVSTSKMYMDVVPRQEWKQIFHEVWRRFRDFFYVENMHGYDWEALRDQYEPLLDHVAHRSDLNYVIGEMIGELNVGHAYKAGGDFERPKRESVGLLGAIFELDQRKNLYRIAKIYAGHNEETLYRSPLTEIGVDVEVGDYILSIDGEALDGQQNPYRLLRGKTSDPVALVVSKTGSDEETKDVSVVPIRSESDLVYLDMVLTNRRRVAELSDGRIGYLHIPDMGASGIREFNKWFYGQLRKEGLVVDVRSNGGGNVSQTIIERLRRELLATGFQRGSELTTTYPRTLFHGYLVCILDEDSASDGDIFPAMFREAGLGPLIGKRSWGGVIGITNRGTLIDGGTVNVPEFGFGSAKGEWIIEGYGVDPDIEVDNDPKSLIEGKDPQLKRAVKEVLSKVDKSPRKLPSRPDPPVKTK
jgi:tricorn protease